MTLYNIHEQQFSNLSSFLLRAHNRNPPQKTLSPIPKFPARWFFNFLIFLYFLYHFLEKKEDVSRSLLSKRHVAFAQDGGQLCWQYVLIYQHLRDVHVSLIAINSYPLRLVCVSADKNDPEPCQPIATLPQHTHYIFVSPSKF